MAHIRIYRLGAGDREKGCAERSSLAFRHAHWNGFSLECLFRILWRGSVDIGGGGHGASLWRRRRRLCSRRNRRTAVCLTGLPQRFAVDASQIRCYGPPSLLPGDRAKHLRELADVTWQPKLDPPKTCRRWQSKSKRIPVERLPPSSRRKGAIEAAERQLEPTRANNPP